MTQNTDVTVCIATIPVRPNELSRALASVASQTLKPDAIVVEYDHNRTGAGPTKNRALARVTTEWVAFLDDDDEMMPQHLERLVAAQRGTGVDVVYSMPYIPQIADHIDPSGMRGAPFDPDELRRRSYIQTTSLIRADLFKKVGGFQVAPGTNYDDWGGFLALLEAGAEFYHLAEHTFIWNHWGYGQPGIPGNTSGVPTRW